MQQQLYLFRGALVIQVKFEKLFYFWQIIQDNIKV